MNKNFNVLWLDDEDISSLDPVGVRQSFSQLTITKIEYTDDCIKILSNKNNFDAVILDACGKSRENIIKEPSPEEFISLVELALQQHIGVFIYSGEINKDEKDFDYAESFLKSKNILLNQTYFRKSSTTIKDLLQHVLEYLEDIYRDFPVFKELYKYLKPVDRAEIENLVKWKIGEGDFPNITRLRTTLKDEIIGGVLPGKLFGTCAKNFNFFGPESKCSFQDGAIEMWRRHSISYLSVLNILHDNSEKGNEQMHEMIFNASLALVEWVTDFMKKYTEKRISDDEFLSQYVKLTNTTPQTSTTNPNKKNSGDTTPIENSTLETKKEIIGKLVFDDPILHVGNCLISPKVLYSGLSTSDLLKGKVVKIVKSDNNTRQAKETFPIYAKKIEIIEE